MMDTLYSLLIVAIYALLIRWALPLARLKTASPHWHWAWRVILGMSLVVLCRRLLMALDLILPAADLVGVLTRPVFRYGIPLCFALAVAWLAQVLHRIFLIPQLPRAQIPTVAMNWLGTIIAWNDACEDLFGWSAEEVLGHELAEVLVPERFRAQHREALRQGRTDANESPILSKPFDTVALTKAETEILVEVTVTASRHHGMTVYVGLIRPR